MALLLQVLKMAHTIQNGIEVYRKDELAKIDNIIKDRQKEDAYSFEEISNIFESHNAMIEEFKKLMQESIFEISNEVSKLELKTKVYQSVSVKQNGKSGIEINKIIKDHRINSNYPTENDYENMLLGSSSSSANFKKNHLKRIFRERRLKDRQTKLPSNDVKEEKQEGKESKETKLKKYGNEKRSKEINQEDEILISSTDEQYED